MEAGQSGAISSAYRSSGKERITLHPLTELIETFALIDDRNERIQALISLGQQFRPVSPEIAAKPYPEHHRVPGCESEVFVWGTQEAGKWDFHFAVENPQGLSAMAMAYVLSENLRGRTREEVLAVPEEVVYDLFGRELSMGKNMGLQGMVQMCKRIVQSS